MERREGYGCMEEEDSRFDGLTVTLKKRKLCVGGAVKQNSFGADEYLVLGHFDQMTVRHTNKWLDWAPYNTETISLEDEYVDKYHIKAYFPEGVKRDQYEKDGFDYQIWTQEDKPYPFSIASVINISEEYAKSIKSNGKLFGDVISELILECVQELSFSDLWKEMHGAFFPTIGYSDLILLFQTDNPEPVLTLLEHMKQKKALSPRTKCRYPQLSNAYTFLGFSDRGLDCVDDSKLNRIKLSVRFGMNAGISGEVYLNYLEWILGKSIGEHYQVLGDSDVMLVPQVELKSILGEYFLKKDGSPGIFHPAHGSFEYVRSMQTSFQIDLSQSDTVDFPEMVSSDDTIERYRSRYRMLLKKLDDFLKQHRMPGRIVYGLQIVMKRYMQMIQSRHSFDMKTIIGNAFSNFAKCIERDMEIVEGLGESYQKYDEIRQMLMAMNMFRERIGEYLADMQRSDSLFLEGRSLSHPSIGSATKLLFFYNGYIDNVKAQIWCWEKDRYSFVVISGGTDQTQAIDLFSHLNPADAQIPSVILVTVPEASLYDVKSSQFHVLHEMLHFCGERKRQERLKHIIEVVSGYTACLFGDFMESIQRTSVEYTLHSLSSYIQSKTEIAKTCEKIFDKQTMHLKGQLRKLLENQILCQTIDLSEEKYYGREVYDWLYVTMQELFYHEDKDTGLKNEIYDLYQEYQICLLRELDHMMKKCGIPYSNFSLIADTYEKTRKDTECDNGDRRLIEYLVGIYFGQDVKLEKKYGDVDEQDVNGTLEALLGLVENLFKECYADCMAGDIMEISPAQFVMSFLSEARNEQEAFSKDNLTRMRLIIDFKYLFGIDNQLSADVSDAIREYTQKEQKKGASHIYEVNISWLNDLLCKNEKERERLSTFIDPVLDYLYSCREAWKQEGIDLKNIQTLNACTEIDTPEETYMFLNYVTDNWMCYAE